MEITKKHSIWFLKHVFKELRFLTKALGIHVLKLD